MGLFCIQSRNFSFALKSSGCFSGAVQYAMWEYGVCLTAGRKMFYCAHDA